MKLPGKLFRAHEKRRRIRDGSVRLRVSSAVRTFYSIRGLRGLLEPRAAMIMRTNYDTFVVADANKMDNRQTILATVYLKDVESYGQFREIQQDYSLRRSALGEVALGHLADQIATELSRQISSRPNHVKRFSKTRFS
jgi:hypothetical protein